MRTEAGKMPESLTFPIKNGLGVSNDRFGFIAAMANLFFPEAGVGPQSKAEGGSQSKNRM